MPSVRELLERERQTVDLEGDHFERLMRRRDRKQRNRRVGALLVAAVLAIATIVGRRTRWSAGYDADPVAPSSQERSHRRPAIRPGRKVGTLMIPPCLCARRRHGE
jgi:hypothetical protein